MAPKIWTDYPFDITDAGSRRVLIVAEDATPALVAEEAKRIDWRKARHVHIACNVPALAFALGMALCDLQANGELADAAVIIVNGAEVQRGAEIKRAGE